MRRRNTTTEFLKECMADALFKLLKEKPLEEITITEITDLADVGRVTFYRNFSKKEDLIAYKLSLLKERFFQDLAASREKDNHAYALHFFTFTYEIRDILSTLYRANLMESMLFSFTETLRQKDMGAPEKRFYNVFMTFGTMGIVTEWIRNDFKETPEELLSILTSIRKNSVR